QVILMDQRIIRQTFLVLYLLLSYDGVQGKIKLSKVEELELEKQLKLINKPSIKIIKTKYGDTYNCVDFYKQPAFDHPMLKYHDFIRRHMKPTLGRSKQNSNASTTNWSSMIWSKDGGCPFGTVPIKKITKEDLVRQMNMPPPEDVTYDTELTTTFNKSDSKRGYISSSKGYKLAIVRILKNPNDKFVGAGMTPSIWKPYAEGQQHSACRLIIKKGSDILQVGWRVDPTLYGDNKTRFFVHFQAGNTHCFNMLCPGFVQVSNEMPADMTFDTISHRGDKYSWEFAMNIHRDQSNGNWWVLVDETYEQVGFWPQKIFTSLASFADNVEWGGVAYNPPGVREPPMGSSYFPFGYSNYDAYCRRLYVLNDEGTTINVDKTNIYLDDYRLYRVLDFPHIGPGEFKHCVFYGGPGE
ncbi:hypothetical protein A4A49_61236, partial [Nicotiana attenuata]